MRTNREAQGNTEGPWERHGALGWGIPMQFWEDKGPRVGNSYAILGIVEKLMK